MFKRIILQILIIIVTLLIGIVLAGVTTSSFTESENSTGNSFQAWTSSLWSQTTQSDFQSGVSINTDTSSSPGDVKLAIISNWYDSNWQCRRAVSLSPATSVADYQVLVTLTTATMGNPYSNVNADGSDIRFTGSDGITLQDYWIESWDNAGTSNIWVQVTNSGTSDIYMYYGNASASSSSNGFTTFDFFDDFSGDLSQWTIDAENIDKVYITSGGGNPSPSLRHDPDSSQTKNSYFDTRLITNNYKILDGIIEYDVYLAGYLRIIHQLGWRVQSLNFENGYCWRLQTANSDGGHLRFTGRASWAVFGTAYSAVSADTWHSVKEVVSGSSYTGYVNEGSGYSGTNTAKLTEDYLVSHAHGVNLDANSYILVDNIRVRRYAFLEPGAVVNMEENMYLSSGTIASQVLDNGFTGATWDALFWDETIEASITDITFEVRASDTVFLKGDASPAWIPVGGASPILSGLPTGQYMQWRATLTTSDTQKTPVLHEVRVYYY